MRSSKEIIEEYERLLNVKRFQEELRSYNPEVWHTAAYIPPQLQAKDPVHLTTTAFRVISHGNGSLKGKGMASIPAL